MAADTVNDRTEIRAIRPDEHRAMKQLARRAFGWWQGSFVTPTKYTFVYELAGELAGVVALETFRYKRTRRGGVVKWLFTDPKAQGRGLAAALVQHGVTQLQELGCHELFTTVEGFNTASSNRFADLGFVPVSPMQQIRRYGLSLIKIGPPTFHTIDLGHFLWARPAEPASETEPHSGADGVGDAAAPSSPETAAPRPSTIPGGGAWSPRPSTIPGGGRSAWATNVVFVAALFALQRLRVGAGGELHAHLVWQLPAAVALVFGVRSAAMNLAAWRVGLELRYRIWETGLTLAALITVLFGGLFPSPGSHYPKTVRWSYRTELPRLAIVAFSGAFAVLALAWLILAYEAAGLADAPGALTDVLALAVLPVQALLLFEVLLPFFPFASFNGRRVLDYSRVLWILLAAGTLALFWARFAGW